MSHTTLDRAFFHSLYTDCNSLREVLSNQTFCYWGFQLVRETSFEGRELAVVFLWLIKRMHNRGIRVSKNKTPLIYMEQDNPSWSEEECNEDLRRFLDRVADKAAKRMLYGTIKQHQKY